MRIPFPGFSQDQIWGFVLFMFELGSCELADDYFVFCGQDPNRLHLSIPVMIDLGHCMSNMRHEFTTDDEYEARI